MKILLIGYQKASMKKFHDVMSNLKKIKNKTYLFDNKLIKLFKFMGFGEFQITKKTIKLTIMPNIKNQNLLISKKESLNTFIDNIS